MVADALPNTIWVYWDRGWENSPSIVKKCIETWQVHNSNWTVRILSNENLFNYLDFKKIIPEIPKKQIQVEALSDIIRISLLRNYGGVWVDSTLYCNQPLDSWLHAAVENVGFFAFSKPGPDRLLSSWFIASCKNNYIVDKWYKKTIDYWSSRLERDHYFWFHYLFGELYETDDNFSHLWDKATFLSAAAPHYFAPYNEKFSTPLTAEIKNEIDHPKTPVFKLTHKYDESLITKKSTLNYLLNHNTSNQINFRERFSSIFKGLNFWAEARKRPKLLVAWYGAFDGHGTIGDLLSLQALTNYLHDRKYDVDYVSYSKFRNLSGNRVNWKEVNPNKYRVFIFVCGPILKNHPYLPELLDKFKSCIKVGVGVSLFKEDHFNYVNPFDFVFAREGVTQKYDDIAIVAPDNLNRIPVIKDKKEIVIGISLRGLQGEYGEENCLHELTENTVNKLAETLLKNRKGRILIIENHLKRSGIKPEKIEGMYAKCDLVITSRLHGALLALRHSVPYIAIDQIRNGAKLFNILKDTKWPFVYKIQDIILDDLVLIGTEILSGKHKKLFAEFRIEMLERANYSLSKIDECLQLITDVTH